MTFDHIVAMVQLVFPSSFTMNDFYTFIICCYTFNIIYTFDLYKYITKKLELQNSIWFYLFKPNNDPFISKENILLISKPFFVVLNAISVKLQIFFEVRK